MSHGRQNSNTSIYQFQKKKKKKTRNFDIADIKCLTETLTLWLEYAKLHICLVAQHFIIVSSCKQINKNRATSVCSSAVEQSLCVFYSSHKYTIPEAALFAQAHLYQSCDRASLEAKLFSSKRGSIAHSLSLSTFNRPDMTEILLKRT